MNKSFTFGTLSLLVLLSTASCNVVTEKAGSAPSILTTIQFDLPPVPSRGAPGKRGEGASRGECIFSAQPLTAIVPSLESKTATNVWGLTTSEHPTLFAYVPFSAKCTKLEFIVQDSSGKLIYQMPVTVPIKPSLISIRFPATAPALKSDQLYHWFLKAIVTPKSSEAEAQQPPDIYAVDGWIQRVNLNSTLNQQLKQASPGQQVRLYAANGIWFDALTTLAELRLANPTDAKLLKDWQQLLQTVKLEAFAGESLTTAKLSGTKQSESVISH